MLLIVGRILPQQAVMSVLDLVHHSITSSCFVSARICSPLRLALVYFSAISCKSLRVKDEAE